MKSFLTWIAGIAIGGFAGYGISFIFEADLFLLVGIGILIGSSVGITINIHRDDDFELPPGDSFEADPDSETNTAE